ncbi:MAG: RnfABCDGE type electron transport complex subunit D [Planctomycetota bacterium]|nr:RnfABCDGE type electron transport complex subunit D [Planctomycetota bacterium]
MPSLLVSNAPHVRSQEDTRAIMWTVIVMLIPAGLMGTVVFGWYAAFITVLSVLAAVVSEAICQRIRKVPITIGDGSAVLAGLLFAYVIPPNTPWYVVIIGAASAIVIGKHFFGGLGCNIWNPALVGRAVVGAGYASAIFLAQWPMIRRGAIESGTGWFGERLAALKSSLYNIPKNINSEVDAIAQASPLNAVKHAASNAQTMVEVSVGQGVDINAARDAIEGVGGSITPVAADAWEIAVEPSALDGLSNVLSGLDGLSISQTIAPNVPDLVQTAVVNGQGISLDYWNMLTGHQNGCIGETSAGLLLLGGLFLIFLKIVDWRIPLFYIGTTALLSWILPIGNVGFFSGDPLFSVLAGGLMIGAFFMATDMVTSPMTGRGKIVFAIGCGVLTVLIRNFGGYPEGVCYSILLMNTAVPLIDRFFKPRLFGKVTK